MAKGDLKNQLNNEGNDLVKIVRIWSNATEEEQLDNSELFDVIVEKLCNEKSWNTFDMDYNNPNFVNIIRALNSFDEYIDFAYEIEEAKDEHSKIFFLMLELWKKTTEKVKMGRLENLINLTNENPKMASIISQLFIYESIEFKKERLDCILKLEHGDINEDEIKNIKDTMERLSKVNENIYDKADIEFIIENFKYAINDQRRLYTDDQLLIITNFPDVQNFITKYRNNMYISNMIKYIIRNDHNWIFTISDIMKRSTTDHIQFLQKLSDSSDTKISEEILEQLVCILSDKNYFEIENEEDVNNYFDKKKDICKNILDEVKLEDYFDLSELNIPEKILNECQTREDLIKFAILEYTLGISLDTAKRLARMYGEDIDEFHQDKITVRYIKDIKLILDCDEVKLQRIVEQMKEDGDYGEYWRYPGNIEPDIIDEFVELYNKELYKPENKPEDREEDVEYDDNGNIIKIPVYNVSGDFNMNIRAEAAYQRRSKIKPIENYRKHFKMPNIDYRGNCESYIGNDSIATARPGNGIMVGYSSIYKNHLTACGPYDLNSNRYNQKFDMRVEDSQFRTPKRMRNTTRHGHNEMVKERIILDENGIPQKYIPNYVVWIDEGTEEKQKNPDVYEKMWNETKKAAAQLGIPIVKIDRERYAKIEEKK